ncbi:MAG: 4Fe-4S binding protein [Deltaproteobacteria bacterium]|nr:4Fe-4S binding protein [Deltaproteobacteria bacterium]
MNRVKGSNEQDEFGRDPADGSRINGPSGETIDFHSGEFNRTDNLSDYSGNYRTFEPLGGIVTADMRHQAERLSANRASDTGAVSGAPTESSPALSEADFPTDAGPLTVISRGRTLIVDPKADRGMACAEILRGQGLDCTLWVTKEESRPRTFPRLAPYRMIEAGTLSITGAFGGFSAVARTEGPRAPDPRNAVDEATVFDLVLDLQTTPAYTGGPTPMGYYAPGTDPAALSEAMDELPEMRGRFLRPRFTVFRKDRCLHGRSRTRDCRRCLDICPVGAIRSAGRTVSVDPYLCQGCGSCALVCRADAIQMMHPCPIDLLVRLRDTLETTAGGASSGPTLVISDSGAAGVREQPEVEAKDRDAFLIFNVDQIGRVGLEMLLTALAHGAGRVTVACGPENPAAIQEAAAQQVQMGRAILKGLGMAGERVQFTVLPAPSPKPEPASPEMPSFEGSQENGPARSATSSAQADTRTLVREAAQRLYDQSGRKDPELPLPTGAPFGAIQIDRAVCTLCMACATVCPTRALSAGGDVPRIELIESRCHQCGLCEAACPEKALRLTPRMLCDPKAVDTPALLNQAEPLRCIECGVPFASQAMVDRIRTKLKGHWMYLADRQLRRLQMCRTCRTQDALRDREMNSWNQI